MSRVVVPRDVDDRVLDLLEKQLTRYQQIIGRLAGNSVQVKTWCFTATVAVAAIAIDRDRPEMFAAALVLVGAFFYLDAYYLALEQHFRRVSTDLAERVMGAAPVEPRELVVVARARDAAGWRDIIHCGCTSHVSVIYLVVAVALSLGVVLSVF
jgi:hypothetical protein